MKGKRNKTVCNECNQTTEDINVSNFLCKNCDEDLNLVNPIKTIFFIIGIIFLCFILYKIIIDDPYPGYEYENYKAYSIGICEEKDMEFKDWNVYEHQVSVKCDKTWFDYRK